jgi:Uncharacterized conserved protein (DUF2183)
MGRNSPLLLISDLDDTIKISHTQSKLATVYRGLFRTSAFAGMAQLYGEILADRPARFLLVSSSPPQIRRKIEFFLKKNGFPEAEIVLRDWIRQPSIPKYKLGTILSLVETSEVPVLLIGDDTEHDPEVFAHVHKRFPAKIAARYIHIVRGRELPDGSQGFFTAFDLACLELAAGRLGNDQVLRIGEAVLRAEASRRLIPWFSLKPPLHFVPFVAEVDDTVREIWVRIHEKLQAIPRRKGRK